MQPEVVLLGLDPPPAQPAPPIMAAPPTAPLPMQPVAATRPGKIASLSHARRTAAWTLGGLLAAALTTAIVLTALDGYPTEVMGQPQRYDFIPHYSVGYALTGLLAGGLVLTLTLPDRRSRR